MMYDYCESHSVPYKKTGKLVVGFAHQREYLEDLYRKTRSLRVPPSATDSALSGDKPGQAVPAALLDGDEARELEPDLSPDIACALLSEETGIVDTHTFMESLERDITETGVGSAVCGTSVVRVDPAENGWVVQMKTSSGNDEAPSQTDSVLAKTLINSSGLSGPFILNALRKTFTPSKKLIPMWYAKGSYASYRGPGIGNVKHLIYPVPETGPSRHGFVGLGTHLTLDLGGNIKFGPDIEWIEPPGSEDEETVSDDAAIDYWTAHLGASDKNIPGMYQSIQRYLPGISKDGLNPDYVGIRPKLGPPGSGFQDFVFLKEYSGEYIGGKMKQNEGGEMLTLLGIESPGLTSSLAIGEMVERELR